MKLVPAERQYRRLQALNGYQAPADLRAALVQCFQEDRVVLDLARGEAWLRLEKPLADGAKLLKARAANSAERSYLFGMVKTADQQMMPIEAMREAVSVMNGISAEALGALTEADLQLLVGLAAFYRSREEV